MTSVWGLGALLVAVAVCGASQASAQAQAQVPAAAQLVKTPVTDVCLGCICQAISGCKSEGCEGDVCGLFRITWAYWSDAGKPTNGESPESPDAYRKCVTEPYCAARAVQGYMARFGQDCNGDGEINCYDHMAIHKKGGYYCSGDLPFQYKNTFDQCIAAVASAQGAHGNQG